MYCVRTECIPALHDTILDDGIITDVDIVKYDRVPDHTVISNVYLLEYN